MSQLTDLIAWRDALEKARFAGVRMVQYSDKTVTYTSDAEMRQALSDLERKIAALQSTGPLREVRVNSSKGV